MTVTYCRDDAEFVKPTPRKHPQRSSIQHWQLRDLISCPYNKREIYFVNQNNVNMYHTETKQLTPVMKELTFSPTSITTGCNYLAAGGQRSQLMVRDLRGSWYTQTTVGGSINNAMCIAAHPNGEVRLLISNNDETIKIYSLPTMARVTSLALPTAVNYCAVSPDGRKMVSVGDTNEVFLFDISNTGQYTKVATLTATNDAGFSCAWNQGSDKFAVASQDGFVSVWDIRFASEKLAKLGSKQHPQVKGACRAVKFSPSGPIDLLLYSEHVSYINILDARTFTSRQTIRVSPANADYHISGTTWSPDSRSVFVGLENLVMEYEVDTMGRRCFPGGGLI